MRVLATLFSILFALGLVAGVAIYIYPKPQPPLPPLTGPVDRILIEKAERRMTLFQGETAVRTYPIALGFEPEGDKVREGDGKTPEGLFRIDRRNPQSLYYLSLGLDYPHQDDLVRASAGGYSPGGDIFIHGQPNNMGRDRFISFDWTAGCIAVSNDIMDELWPVVEIGTVVDVRP